MRNLLKRRPRDAAKPTLRERLTATKAKFGKVLVARRALNGPLPSAAPAPDRTALVCYATWLDLERRRVCRDLYPHLGPHATAFRLGMNAGEDWHFDNAAANGRLTDRGRISPRAIKVLDLVGVDWRGDKAKGRGPDDVGRSFTTDNGERPALPHGWPRFDADVLEALDDLNRLDAAHDALGSAGSGGERDANTLPGYDDLELARDDALRRLGRLRAESLLGLRAKAQALLTPSVSADADGTYQDIAESLARDLLGIEQRAIEPRPDPIFEMIEEAWRLTREHGRLLAISGNKPSSHPSHEPEDKAHDAMWEHVRGVLLKTVPTTAAGCVALARFAVAFTTDQGVPLEYESNDPVLGLIARSPLL